MQQTKKQTDMFDTSVFNIAEYQEYLTSDEYKKQQIEQFVDNQRLIKSLSLQNRGILLAFADCEKTKKLYNFVSKVWVNVLDNDTQEYSVEEIVNMALESDENIQFLNDNKNKNYFPSGKVFEDNSSHPVQKKLTKSKHLSKRSVNKQKTPMQTINYVYNAKSNSDRDDRLAEVEKRMKDLDYAVSVLALNQIDIGLELIKQSEDFKDVADRLSVVEGKINDKKKLKLYALYTAANKPTIKEMSKDLDVSERTVKYWLKELREVGALV